MATVHVHRVKEVVVTQARQLISGCGGPFWVRDVVVKSTSGDAVTLMLFADSPGALELQLPGLPGLPKAPDAGK